MSKFFNKRVYIHASFLLSFLFSICSSEISLKSDPDIVSSGFEYNKTIALMLGEKILFKGISVSGLIHVRNEERFNKGVFPNHNWRGVITLSYSADSLFKSLPFLINVGYKHESAHPTMGICCEENNYLHKIYDGSYRRYLLNSIDLRLGKHLTKKLVNVLINFEYHFYFYSKNTPELSGMQDALSHGLSGGVELQFKLKDNHIFVSFFDRIIFEGSKIANGNVYVNLSDNSPIDYPVINKVNTLKSKIGMSLDLKRIKRRLNIYSSFLYGNSFGFIDSREKRNVFTFLGIEVTR